MLQKLSRLLRREVKLKLKMIDPLQISVQLQNFFEKLILKQIHYLECKNKLDLTGKQQHGFKKK